jgi:hypothetical protein
LLARTTASDPLPSRSAAPARYWTRTRPTGLVGEEASIGSLVRRAPLALGLILGPGLLLAACGQGPTIAPGPATSAGALAVATATPDPGGAVSMAPSASSSPAPALSLEPTPLASASTPSSVTALDRLPGEPDPALTPGALNPDVTQATIGSTICVSGWTATIRPPSSYTSPLKVEQIAEYGYTDTSTADYEEDHLIPLELGGAPADPRNLWPEPDTATLPDGRDAGAGVKDRLETSLKREVCAGQITLAAAQAEIGIHWVHAYYGIPLGAGPAAPSATVGPTAVPPTASPRAGSVPPDGSTSVRFVTLPDPAVPGSTATMTARTSPGATCSAKVTWPSGTVSAAAGLKPTPTAGDEGLVSWTWNVGRTTKPGTAKASVTCRLGSSATATATFAVR